MRPPWCLGFREVRGCVGCVCVVRHDRHGGAAMNLPESARACPACVEAAQRHAESGDPVVCVCGVVHAPDDFVWPSEPREAPELPRDSRVQVIVPREPEPHRPKPPRLVRVLEDDELVRVRRLLYELRPDRDGPLGWSPLIEPPRHEEAPRGVLAGKVRVQTSVAVPGPPRDAFASDAEVYPSSEVAARIEAIAARDATSGAVLVWLQRNGTLARGLARLYQDAAIATADAARLERWAGFSVPEARVAQRLRGRGITQRACTVWEVIASGL